ncbi:MAG: hypothetical protein ABIO46_15635 [Chitinophagales bacterium]
MKTFKTLLILVIMLSGHLSFGTGNESCCPDTTSIQLQASNAQLQLDQMQVESHLVIAKVPSLSTNVYQKLGKQQDMLDKVQLETEKLDTSLLSALQSHLEGQLKGRKMHEQATAEKKAIIKL